MNMPRLRFKEFCGEWEVKKLDELADITTGNKDTQNKVDDGKYPFFVRSQTIEKINSFSYDGEAILTSGDGVGVGKNFHYINGKFDYHQRVYCIFNFKNKVLGKYIFFYFSEKFNKRVMRLSAKNSVDSVRRDMITDMSTHIPSLPEQTKIANFLTAVDEKIAQLTQKADLLALYKKGVMQQIFSQQLRFKPALSEVEGDDDGRGFPEWEDGKLDDAFDYKNGKSFENELIENGEYYLITLNSIDISGRLKADHKRVSKSDYSLITNDLIMVLSDVAHGNFLGLTDIIPSDKFVLNQRMGGLRAKMNIDVRFASLYINYNQKYFKLHGQGSSQLNLSKGSVLDFDLPRPCLREQTKIANFLTVLDEKITHNQTQLNALKHYKQGLLQQLFV